MLYLVPFFLLLVAGWAMLGWSLAQERRWDWFRRLCSQVFIITLCVLVAGAAGFAARWYTKRTLQNDVARTLDVIEDRLEAGDSAEVLAALRGRSAATNLLTDPVGAEDPDNTGDAHRSRPALLRIAEIREALAPEPVRTADTSEGPRQH